MKTTILQQNQTDKKATNIKEIIVAQPLINLEQVTDSNFNAVCRVTTNNLIKFCNSDFTKISGYTEKELIKHSFSLIKHPEMPVVISDYINYHLERGKQFTCILKNKTKEGKYFWTLSNFKPNKNSNYNLAYTLTSNAISEKAKVNIKKLYHCLYSIETNINKKTTFKYLIGFLEEKRMSFTEYMSYLASLK